MKSEKWDIKKHIKDHADYCLLKDELLKEEENFIHFTFSFEDIQFFNRTEPPQEILREFLKELFKEAEYKVRNGWDTLSDGSKVQRYAKRKINLGKLTLGWAIHTKGSLGEHTHPHPHLLLLANGRYGKNFSLLRLHISKISQQFGLIPHFDEIKENRLKNLHDSVKKFFWLLKKKPSADFKAYFFKRENKELLSKMLEKLEQYTLATNNTLFYFKTMQSLQKRLKDNKINFIWNGHNIREVIPVENILSKQDYKVIDLINQKKFNQKDIKEYLQNPILRDFARYSYYKDLKKSFIIKGLKETTLLKNPQPNQKLLNNFMKLYEKQNRTKKRKSQLSKEDNLALFLKNKLLEVARKSINEKELRDNLLSEYNIQLKLKKRKGKVIGYTFVKDGTEHYFKQDEIIKISDLREILKNNRNYFLNLPTKLKEEKKPKIIYKKEKYESELQNFIKYIEPTLTRANSEKLRADNEIERANNVKCEIETEIQGIQNFSEDTKQQIERIENGLSSIKQRIREFKNSIPRTIGATIRERITELRERVDGKVKRMAREIGRKIYDGVTELYIRAKQGLGLMR